MQENQKTLFTLKSGDKFLIECLRKDKPYYTYRHKYSVVTTKMNTSFDILAQMALTLLEETRVISYDEHRKRGMDFTPYYEIEDEDNRNIIRRFNLVITFPYDD